MSEALAKWNAQHPREAEDVRLGRYVADKSEDEWDWLCPGCGCENPDGVAQCGACGCPAP